MDAETALESLIEGNQRYQAKNLTAPTLAFDDMAQGQSPRAAILSCADSRVVPEMIFDQSPGELFIVRVAGNAAGPSQMASIEFGVLALGCPLVVVLGHESCAAVTACVNKVDPGIQAWESIADVINPAVNSDLSVHENIKANAQYQARVLSEMPALAKAQKENGVLIKAANFDVATGRVDFL